jgi:hypothetical protein
MKDVVVGAITGYDFDKIRPWVNSLDRSGFDGLKVMLCYNISYDVAEELTKRGYSVFALRKNDEMRRFEYRDNFSIVVERFIHIWHFLKSFKGQYRNIVCTDVKDVVFQTNPSEWFDKNLGDKKICVGTESIRYRDEDWGRNNLQKSFGNLLYEELKDNLIYNAGTISGEFDTMIDFFLNIYMLCNGTKHSIEGGGGPDQAALNILLNTKTYKDITKFNMSEDGYAAQLGTTGPQVLSRFGQYLVEKTPIMVGDNVCTSDGTPFCLIHQYDRVPEWKKIIEEKYA